LTDDDVQARLAAQLRELRLAAGLGGIEAGRQAGISQSKISKLERGALRPSPGDVRTLASVYGATESQRDEMIRLAETVKTGIIEPPRVTLSRGAAYQQQRWRRLEESATLLRSYQPTMVIGLVQTPAYATLVFTGGGVAAPEAEQAVAARIERQAQLRRRVPHAVLIMTEGALRWQAGSPQVMIEQIEAIITATELPNVELGIIPFSTPVTFFPRHGWHLYDSDAVVVGTETGVATITDADDIARYESIFSRLQEIASTGDAARAALARIAADYRSLLLNAPTVASADACGLWRLAPVH
jgi:transcriptional regulator with XRE-family HTH domain